MFYPLFYIYRDKKSHQRTKCVIKPNLGVLAQCSAKPIYWPQVVVKEITAFISGPSKENRQLMLKRPELPDGFQRRVSKGSIRGEGCRVPDQLVDILLISWCWGNTAVFQMTASSTFWSQLVWGLSVCGQHAINFFHLVGTLVPAKQLKDTDQVII